MGKNIRISDGLSCDHRCLGNAKMKPVKLEHPLVGGYRKVICTTFKTTASGHHCISCFPSFTSFNFLCIGWKCCNLDLPAQTAEENEPVFDEQNLVLSPGVNTHT